MEGGKVVEKHLGPEVTLQTFLESLYLHSFSDTVSFLLFILSLPFLRFYLSPLYI